MHLQEAFKLHYCLAHMLCSRTASSSSIGQEKVKEKSFFFSSEVHLRSFSLAERVPGTFPRSQSQA